MGLTTLKLYRTLTAHVAAINQLAVDLSDEIKTIDETTAEVSQELDNLKAIIEESE